MSDRESPAGSGDRGRRRRQAAQYNRMNRLAGNGSAKGGPHTEFLTLACGQTLGLTTARHPIDTIAPRPALATPRIPADIAPRHPQWGHRIRY